MQLKPKTLEQHIAVFGESGSGKTVMLSSFYGAMQEPKFTQSSLFDVLADKTGQGNQLYRNYLGMRDDGNTPIQTRFRSTSYAFTMKLKPEFLSEKNRKPFDALRLVWHDYPGEWFEQDTSGAEEEQRRLDAFKDLLGSDVALVLVDAQKLLDHPGEEDRYLKSLLGNLRTGLLRLRDDILDEGRPLVKFPRIWVMALSKADLMPDVDVYAFRDLIIKKATDELEELRTVIAGLIDSPDALAVGEDFMLTSSAKFEPNRIEVTERIGLDLLLPIAAMLPIERHRNWVNQKKVGAKATEYFLVGAEAVAAALLNNASPFNPKAFIARVFGGEEALAALLDFSREKLVQMHRDAELKQDYFAAVITDFQLEIKKSEADNILYSRP